MHAGARRVSSPCPLTSISARVCRSPSDRHGLWSHGLGTRLGHIRVKSDEELHKLTRKALCENHEETQCPLGFQSETLRWRGILESPEPSSQCGSHIRLELVSMEIPVFPWGIDDPFPARGGCRCPKSEAANPLPIADGAYAAPISADTTEHLTERVGTKRDEDPTDTRVSAIAGDRAGSLGMGFRGLAVKGSGVRIPSAPPERQPLKPLLRQGFRRTWVQVPGGEAARFGARSWSSTGFPSLAAVHASDNTNLFNDRLQAWDDFYTFNRPRGGLAGETP